MKRIALSLLVLLPALAADPATNAPAATPARADVDASVLAKLDRIIVPEFEFKNADICDVVSRLGDCSREFDDETAASKRGVGFVLDLGGDASTIEEGDGLFAESPSSGVPPLTIKAKDWSLRALLDLVVEMADLKYRIEGGHVAIRRKDDMRGETFERWRFTILPDLVTGHPAAIDELMDCLGELGVCWPPGASMERSGDNGFVVRNTRENLDTIRMALGALSVTVLQGEPVVLEDAPATNAPAAALAPAEVDAASDCARFLESAFREIDPGTNGAPAAVVLGDLRWSMACESSISSDSGSAVRHCPWHPEAGERIVIPDKTELTLHIGKHQFVRIARIPPDTSLPESLDEKDRAVADGVGGPLLVVERRENYSSFGHAERNVAIRHFILPPGAREGHPFHPSAGAPARFLFADLAPAHAEPVPHAAPAEEEPHAESAENAEPDPHAEPAWGDAMYFLDLLEWQKRNPDAFAAALAALAKDFATNAPVAEEMQ